MIALALLRAHIAGLGFHYLHSLNIRGKKTHGLYNSLRDGLFRLVLSFFFPPVFVCVLGEDVLGKRTRTKNNTARLQSRYRGAVTEGLSGRTQLICLVKAVGRVCEKAVKLS